ncbi:PREDICTED: DNA polymerase zeta catalytic subunit [Ceratosolen solmsi marchali]|uniref:DNA polymerase n=1 Tax=Ceratosolen solmsi marchali TaxID=326594 RepID=A0AAJ6YHG4_9HYME|nr:PREDICTED: DNA polymerase zeta catalytic subunit [Ceratosolen solmsi marchali]
MYSVRLVSADSYQAAPIPDVDPTFSQFRGSDIKQVPVVRIFGITHAGEKVCLHVHGVFPYMYVPYSGHVNADMLVYRLAASLDANINVSLGSSNSKRQHVYKIQQVSGIPFYGYHKKAHHFLKIYFYNPAMMKRAIDLLQNGRVLGQIFQPHEAHISFILQFMIDYNIYGMSMIDLRYVKHRHSAITDQNLSKLSDNLDETLDFDVEKKEYMPHSIAKQSVCKLEMDAWASDILNRDVIDKGIDLNPGIAAIWEEEKARRVQFDLGGDSQLTYPKSPERSQVSSLLKNNDRYHEKRLAQRLSAIDSQMDDASSSPGSENSSYPIPVSNDSKLLNASQLEVHAGPLESTRHNTLQSLLHRNTKSESTVRPSQSSSCDNNISLSSSDLDIVDILVNLAEEQQNISSSIDSNSILGSQNSQADQNFPIMNDKEMNDEEEEDVEDLNITLLELSSLNFSQWESKRTTSQEQQGSENDGSQIELVLESLKETTISNLFDNIPQFDGPIDDDDIRSQLRDNSVNETIERQEFLTCEYKSGKRPKCATSVTPSKTKETSGSSEKRTRKSTKKNKFEDSLPKTPHRSPSKRLKKITSPSCPSRNYSPLKIEIRNAQKTEAISSCATPSTSYVGQKVRKNLQPKRILSALQEFHPEGEDVRPASASIKKPSGKTLATQISEKSFARETEDDNDKTLVEDSDDSLETVVSMPNNPVFINETDSNDTIHSNEKLSNLSATNFSDDLAALEMECIGQNELSFNPLIGRRSNNLSDRNVFSMFSDRRDVCVTMSPKLKSPSRECIVGSLKSPGIAMSDNARPHCSKQSDAKASAEHEDDVYCDNNDNQRKSKEDKNQESFYRSFGNIAGLANWRKMKIQELNLSEDKLSSLNLEPEFPNGKTVAIRPLKAPPDRKSVIAWLEARDKEQKDKTDETNQKSNAESQDPRDSDTNSLFLDPTYSRGTFRGVGGDSGASKHLGVSCGQIEFDRRSSIMNVEHGNFANAKALTTYQFLTILCLEVHVITRSKLLPDPQYDAIGAVFYAIYNDVPPDWEKTKPLECGIVIVESAEANSKCKSSNYANAQKEQSIVYVENEIDMFNSVLSIIERHDPEILIGWDLELLSWGYMFQRASLLGRNLSCEVSRIRGTSFNWGKERDQASSELHLETLGELRLPGRIVLDIWRLMRHEIALTSYTYENVMFHVMNERIPHPSFEILTNWWATLNCRWRVIDHYTNKVIGVHRILHHLDIINRTSEHARLYGIQFYEVFSRGSQFRVESMMLRLAKPLNYIPVSPSAQQRGCMRAPESLPLILEPESTMYCDPVVVLDFQSLYPSIIIAYNYCFSTCLGRVEHIGAPQPFTFGATSLKVDKTLAKKLLNNKINFAPCGVAFVKEEVRRGILPRMLTEILETRLMVKKAIKDHSKEDRALQRALDSRQLGLKLIANVTYGYTAANFSGRMPCIEVGDSVVSKGKETLERAIKMVESTPKWGARVIYGDTDSLFVLLKGKSREEAFNIGAEIAETVTAANPKPVKLKFEKVMQPCILQTKKRYCGYIYENKNDKPVYLAKGIETVRRDGCPAVAKILEKTLRILFETKDLSLVKQYVTRQLDKILTHRVSIQDLIFAKEFRGMKGYKPTACVPALELTKRLIQKDPRAIPNTGSRVPYIIVAGGPNVPLIRCVRSPMELILDPNLRPNAIYYITKVIIPPLNRCLNLIGVDAYSWFMDMPHRQRSLNRVHGDLLNVNRKPKTTISQYLYNTACPSCGELCDRGICEDCIKNQTQTLVVLYEKCRQYERIYSNIKMMCESCIGIMDCDSCTSLDCPIFYRRIQAQIDNTQVSYLYNLIQCMEYLS